MSIEPTYYAQFYDKSFSEDKLIDFWTSKTCGGFGDYEIDRSLSEDKWVDFWTSKTCGRVWRLR